MSMNRKHVLIMLACCLVPLAAWGAIAVFRVPVTSVLYVGLVLLCPAMHLLMMRNMGHDHGDAAHDPHHPAARPPQSRNRAPVDDRGG